MTLAKTALLVAVVVASAIVVAAGSTATRAQHLDQGPCTSSCYCTHRRSLLIGRYAFASWPSNAQTRPWQILVSSVSPEYPTSLTCRIYPRTRTGRIHQPLTLGHGPYKLLVLVRNKFGGHTRLLTQPLRPRAGATPAPIPGRSPRWWAIQGGGRAGPGSPSGRRTGARTSGCRRR
jgi:hypothetical protein